MEIMRILNRKARNPAGGVLMLCAVLLVSACSSSIDGAVSSAGESTLVSMTDDSSTAGDPAVATATQLGTQVSTALGCTLDQLPTDMLQSPYKIATVNCGNLNDNGANIYVFSNPSEKAFALSSIELGDVSYSYLVDQDWVIIGQAGAVTRIKTTIGGKDYTNASAALQDSTIPTELDKLTACQQFTTAAAMDFVANKSDAITKIDTVVPGFETYFDGFLLNRVESLPSFGGGDPDRAATDLLPFVDVFRDGCKEFVGSMK